MFHKRRVVKISVSVLLVSITIILLCYNFFQNNHHKESKSSRNEYELMQDYVLDLYNLNKDLKNCYAGSYYDNTGVLNIKVTNNILPEQIEKLKNMKIKFSYAKFSLKYLEGLMDKFGSKMTSLGINAIELSQAKNRVYIYMEVLDEARIKAIKKIVDSPAIEFKRQIGQLQFW